MYFCIRDNKSVRATRYQTGKINMIQFTVNSVELCNRLQSLSKVVLTKGLHLCRCILFSLGDGNMTLSATDIETFVRCKLNIYDSKGKGEFAVQAQLLSDMLRNMPGQPICFIVDQESNQIRVSYCNGKNSFMSEKDVHNFPKCNQLKENTKLVTFHSSVLSENIKQALPFTADDELRPVMNCVYLDILSDKVAFVASDGQRLIRKILNISGNEQGSFLIPKKSAKVICGMLSSQNEDVHILFDNSFIRFECEDVLIVVRQTEGRFPNYNSVIPTKNNSICVLDKDDFASVVKRTMVFAAETMLGKFTFSDCTLSVSAQDIEKSLSSIETLFIEYVGEKIEIGFKSSCLVDILENIPDRKIKIEMTDSSHAGIFCPETQKEDTDLLVLIMPMMLS